MAWRSANLATALQIAASSNHLGPRTKASISESMHVQSKWVATAPTGDTIYCNFTTCHLPSHCGSTHLVFSVPHHLMVACLASTNLSYKLRFTTSRSPYISLRTLTPVSKFYFDVQQYHDCGYTIITTLVEAMPLQDLPAELLLGIFVLSTSRQLYSISSTCRRLHRLAEPFLCSSLTTTNRRGLPIFLHTIVSTLT